MFDVHRAVGPTTVCICQQTGWRPCAAPVEDHRFHPLKSPRNVPASMAAGPAAGSRCPDRGVSPQSASPSAMAVLPTPGSPTKRGCSTRRHKPAPCGVLLRPIRGSINLPGRWFRLTVNAERVAPAPPVSSSSSAPSPCSSSYSSPESASQPSLMPCEMYVRISSRVMPCCVARVGIVLSSGQQVARIQFAFSEMPAPWPVALPFSAGLFGKALAVARHFLEIPVEKPFELVFDGIRIGPAFPHHLPPVRIVHQGIQQMLDAEILMAAPARFLHGRRQCPFDRPADHGSVHSSSMVHIRGYPRERASSCTVAILASAIWAGYTPHIPTPPL